MRKGDYCIFIAMMLGLLGFVVGGSFYLDAKLYPNIITTVSVYSAGVYCDENSKDKGVMLYTDKGFFFFQTGNMKNSFPKELFQKKWTIKTNRKEFVHVPKILETQFMEAPEVMEIKPEK